MDRNELGSGDVQLHRPRMQHRLLVSLTPFHTSETVSIKVYFAFARIVILISSAELEFCCKESIVENFHFAKINALKFMAGISI